MTDLERARRMLRDWGDEADTVIADELAAARLESAARAAEKAYANGFRRGAEEMRERAAQVAAKYDATSPSNVGNIHPDYFYGQENAADGIADAIRTLPLTPEEPT